MKSIHPLLICVIIFFAGCEKKEPAAKTEGPSAKTKPVKEIRQDIEKEARE